MGSLRGDALSPHAAPPPVSETAPTRPAGAMTEPTHDALIDAKVLATKSSSDQIRNFTTLSCSQNTMPRARKRANVGKWELVVCTSTRPRTGLNFGSAPHSAAVLNNRGTGPDLATEIFRLRGSRTGNNTRFGSAEGLGDFKVA